MPDLTARIIKSRNKKGLSQEALARLCGCNQATISRIESGAIRPKMELILSISQHLELAISVNTPTNLLHPEDLEKQINALKKQIALIEKSIVEIKKLSKS